MGMVHREDESSLGQSPDQTTPSLFTKRLEQVYADGNSHQVLIGIQKGDTGNEGREELVRLLNERFAENPEDEDGEVKFNILSDGSIALVGNADLVREISAINGIQFISSEDPEPAFNDIITPYPPVNQD